MRVEINERRHEVLAVLHGRAAVRHITEQLLGDADMIAFGVLVGCMLLAKVVASG